MLEKRKQLDSDFLEVKEKITRLSVPKGFGVAAVLVYIGDISDSVVDSQYFYRIINLDDWLVKIYLDSTLFINSDKTNNTIRI